MQTGGRWGAIHFFGVFVDSELEFVLLHTLQVQRAVVIIQFVSSMPLLHVVLHPIYMIRFNKNSHLSRSCSDCADWNTTALCSSGQ
jgi:hypothetical protein